MNPYRLLPLLGLLAFAAPRANAQTAPEATDKVRLFNDTRIRAGETVSGDALAIMGDVTVDAGGAQVHRSVISVGGDCVINGTVHGSVTALRGDVFLGATALVEGNVVARGGHVHRDAKARVGRSVNEIALGSAEGLSPLLSSWWDQGLSRGRLLIPSLHPRLLWIGAAAAMMVAVGFSLLFGGPVRLCADTLVQRPGVAVVSGVFGVAGFPVIFALLCASVVGIPLALLLLPVALIAVLGIGGTAVLLAVGKALTGGKAPAPAAVALAALLLAAIGLAPYVGLAITAVAAFAGLGALIGTLVVPAVESKGAASVLKAGLATQTFPQATFGIRIAAGLVDLILIVVVTAVVHGFAAPQVAIEPIAFAVLLFTAYSTLMWRWNGATVGALLCGIRIVRVDDKPMDWTTSIVRVLGSQLSLAVFGLGFLTVGLGKGRPAWHDRMAGTMAVRG